MLKEKINTRATSANVACICLLSIWVIVTTAVAADHDVSEVIENIRVNEQLYQDIEVVLQTSYDIGERTPLGGDIGNEVSRSEARTRYVAQGEWFRLERAGESQTLKGAASRNLILSYDGDKTRLLHQDGVGNITEARLVDRDFVKPHLLIIRDSGFTFPFSVYLSGHEAIMAHPGRGKWNESLSLGVSYEGLEELDGLKCRKLFANVLLNGQPQNGTRLWIAEDRNYLPIKRLSYTYRCSKDTPKAEAYCRDLREIRAGVWFPFDVEITAYNPDLLQTQNRQALQWRQRIIVESADLDPNYDRSFFSDVKFPDGTAMYIVDDGKITKSWGEGDPATAGPSQSPSNIVFSRWWRIWANLLVLIFIGGLLWYRRLMRPA